MRLRFDETTLTKNPKNPISADVQTMAPPSVANYLDLCHLPADSLPWLFTRTTAQVNAAAMVGKTAFDNNIQIADGGLLRADHNVMVLVFQSGVRLSIYPDGSLGFDGQVIEASPEVVLATIGGSDAEAPEANGMVQPDAGTDPTTGTQIDTGGMDNLAAVPGAEPVLGQIGDPVEIHEPMINSEFYGDAVDGVDPVADILHQIGAMNSEAGVSPVPPTPSTPKKGERPRR